MPVILTTRQWRDPGNGVGEARWSGDVGLPFPDAGIDGGGQMVAVAGPTDHRRETEVVKLPTEQLSVEVGRRDCVAGVQIAEVPTAGCVDQLGARSPPRLPQPEARASRIDTAGKATAGSSVDGLHCDDA